MKVLVGVSVFRVPDLVGHCLNSLVGCPADVLVVDNAADQDVKQVVQSFSGRVKTIVNASNGFCNGGWNQIMKYGLENNYDVIGLGSSDATLLSGWYEVLVKRVEQFPKEICIPNTSDGTETVYAESCAGFFSFLPREAVDLVYPIPQGLQHWFGDQYIFEKLRSNGWKTAVVSDLKAQHQQSAITFRTPEAYTVIEQDKLAWRNLNVPRV